MDRYKPHIDHSLSYHGPYFPGMVPLLGVILLLAFASCQSSFKITKRQHLPGYHVQLPKFRSHKIPVENAAIPANSRKPTHELPPNEEVSTTDPVITRSPAESAKPIPKSNRVDRVKSQPVDQALAGFLRSLHPAPDKFPIVIPSHRFIPPETEKRMEAFGIAAVLAGILSLLLLGALIFNPLYGFLGSVGYGIMAILFGIVSLGRHNENPDTYSTKTLAKAGIWMGAFALAINLILLLVAVALVLALLAVFF